MFEDFFILFLFYLPFSKEVKGINYIFLRLYNCLLSGCLSTCFRYSSFNLIWFLEGVIIY